LKQLNFLKKIVHALAFSGALFFIYSCAAVSAPAGGPEDKTPPNLVFTKPESETLQFKGGRVILSFSEYIDEKSILNAVKVAPRLESPLELIYEDDEIILDFPENLMENQTYVITINRNLKDERKVALSKSIQVAFSTGNIIDQGIIAGRVYGNKDYAVHLWKVEEGFSDSIFFTEPLYVSEADKEGNFEFKYLAPADYILLGLDRSSAGTKLIPERMAYGVSSQKVFTLDEKETINNISIRLYQQLPPLKLTHAEWIGQKWGWIYFNKELESLEIGKLKLTDESQKELYPLIYHDLNDKARALMIVNDTIAKGKVEIDNYLLEGEPGRKITFRVSSKKDTTNLKKVKPEGFQSIRLEKNGGPSIPIVFSKPIIEVKDSAFILIADLDTSIIPIEWINPTQISFIPSLGWLEKIKYELLIFSDKLIPIEGKTFKDSIINITINSEKKIGYGGVNGSLKDKETPTLIKLSSLVNDYQSFYSTLDSTYKFIFNNIPEGDYSLTLIEDTDNSGSFTYGNVLPFKPSEWFYIYPDTINVRSNWDIDIGSIQIGVK